MEEKRLPEQSFRSEPCKGSYFWTGGPKASGQRERIAGDSHLAVAHQVNERSQSECSELRISAGAEQRLADRSLQPTPTHQQRTCEARMSYGREAYCMLQLDRVVLQSNKYELQVIREQRPVRENANVNANLQEVLLCKRAELIGRLVK
jgi:hypothetical protein